MKTACVIMAAGHGKRMRSALVKVMHPVCGEPMIDYPVRLAQARGYDPIVVVIGHQAQVVRAHLEHRFGDALRFVIQDPPQGTGHAVLMAARALKGFSGKLVILSGDVPLLSGAELNALARAGRGAAVAFLTCALPDPGGYGRVVRDASGGVQAIVEHRDADQRTRSIREINTGIYEVEAPFVFRALRRVGRDNAQGEYYLTDLIALARARGLTVRGRQVEGVDAVLGINDRRALAEAERMMNLRHCQRLMDRGVSVVDPATTYLGPDVRVGADSVILPGCHLHGDVRIGKGCLIGPGAILEDARVDHGAEIRAYSVLEDCRVGRAAQVGPFARLRPGTLIEAEARVGNFVETKKTRLGRGAKASHLSYLGDADVGAGVNVGAGTITCNYDGVHKHPTRIGDGAFIGSDTQLVAPVTVGKGAYVGAGTTVTRDVPPEALAISRTRQRNIEGFARRKKPPRP